MAKKILVTGASGMVASRFVQLSKDLNLLTPDLDEFELTNNNLFSSYIQAHRPDLILHFAAFTDVNAAENQTGNQAGLCWQINVRGTKKLLEVSIPIIYISTDMVFSGGETDPGPYAEDHPTPTSPERLTWYGWTKNQAEKLVLKENGTVIRIIYPVRAHFPVKKDYLRQPLSLFAQEKLYPLFDDQQISFTFIDEFATVLHRLINNPTSGIFHVSSDTFTPYELITYAIKKMGGDPSSVQKNSVKPFLAKQANPFRYPVSGGLSAIKTEKKLGLKFKTWQEVIDELIGQGLTLD